MYSWVIETCGLTKKYKAQNSVDHLDMHVPPGKIYALLGRNGAGKSTTMKLLLNLVRPTDGTIALFGEDNRKCPAAIYRRVGALVEAPGFYENLTGAENLEILARLRGRRRKETVSRALEIVGLDGEEHKTFGRYSLGMKQRLGIAAAIMHEPEILILDEPVNGLDPIGIYEIRKYLLQLSGEKGVTILISSHIMSEIEQIADIVGVMHEGRLVEETDMESLRKRSRRYVEYDVSDVNRAALILERDFRISDYAVADEHLIRVYEGIDRRAQINGGFTENGLMVSAIDVKEEKLEDYFSNLIGGGTIG